MSIVWLKLLIVFAIAFLVYHTVGAKYRWMILLLASIGFILIAAGIISFWYMFFAILVSFFGSNFINKVENNSVKQLILGSSILLIIAEFVLLKFSGALSQLSTNVSEFFATTETIAGDAIVTLGVSYYSLILIAYITDVYRKVTTVETNFLKHSLFSTYFPQILMGPIVRHKEMKEQLFSTKEISFDCIKFGVFRILWGITKKIVIADRILLPINTILGSYQEYSGMYILFAMILFGLQFYIEFSAAMDIVLGISECFGIKMPENFNNPFFSKSVHDFWNRWHITFYSFLKDYIFYPVIRSKIMMKIKSALEGIKHKWLAKHIPLFIAYFVIWSISSFRHGISFKYFIAMGMSPCIFMILEDIFKLITDKVLKIKSLKNALWAKIIQRIYVLTAMYLMWFFFRAETVSDCFNMFEKVLFDFNSANTITTIGVDKYDFGVIIIGITLIIIVDLLKEFKVDLRGIYIRCPLIVRWCAIIFFQIVILLLGLYGPEYDPKDFMYFKF
ncbi:MAG: MBOAT family protein [Candidatus Gastranaerophilales bacterium]|nr:MBOAT family protein [Candidatus Gastranaerophilales bacterium]